MKIEAVCLAALIFYVAWRVGVSDSPWWVTGIFCSIGAIVGWTVGQWLVRRSERRASRQRASRRTKEDAR